MNAYDWFTTKHIPKGICKECYELMIEKRNKNKWEGFIACCGSYPLCYCVGNKPPTEHRWCPKDKPHVKKWKELIK